MTGLHRQSTILDREQVAVYYYAVRSILMASFTSTMRKIIKVIRLFHWLQSIVAAMSSLHVQKEGMKSYVKKYVFDKKCKA